VTSNFFTKLKNGLLRLSHLEARARNYRGKVVNLLGGVFF
jgi:hypothetical protein